MFFNSILHKFQMLLKPVYDRSFVLKKIDLLVFINIILLIIFSTVCQSDFISYFAIISILLTFIKLITKPNEHFFMTTADKFLLIYFLTVLISVAGSSLFAYSLKGFMKTLIYLGFYISLVHYLKDNKNKIKYILLTIAGMCALESLVAIKQNFLSVSEISGWQDVSRLNPEQVMTRVYGTLKPYNPNLFGGYMLAALPANLVLIFLPLLNKHYKTAILGLGALLLSAITLALTGCRGAYIGLFFELIVLGLLTYKYLKPAYKKLFLTISSILSAIGVLIILSSSSLKARILSIFAMRSDSSNSFRFNVYNSCIQMFKDNWILGIGVGNQNFREIYGLYMKTGFDALSAYNIYLETAVESGIFALLSFITFLGVNIYRAIKHIFNKKTINNFYLIITLVSLTGILTHGIVDTVFFRPQIQFLFWIMVAIIRVITITKAKKHA